MNNRRKILTALGAGALAPAALFAQTKPPVVIGFLSHSSRQQTIVLPLKEGLATLGWKEGQDYVLEARWSEGRIERLRPLAEDIAAKTPSVIVGVTSPAVAAVARAAPNTPIVVTGGDPVGAGFVSNLARPGGMITGLSNNVSEVDRKHPELLLDAVPKLRRVGFLVDPNAPFHKLTLESARRAVAQRSVEAYFAEASRPEEIEPAISSLAKQGSQALVILSSPLFSAERLHIIKLATDLRWPTIAGSRRWAEAGGLLAYGADGAALLRRAAFFIDRILKGAKPGDLPIERPTTYDLVVNLKTARALGIKIPDSILVRATKVIE